MSGAHLQQQQSNLDFRFKSLFLYCIFLVYSVSYNVTRVSYLPSRRRTALNNLSGVLLPYELIVRSDRNWIAQTNIVAPLHQVMRKLILI